LYIKQNKDNKDNNLIMKILTILIILGYSLCQYPSVGQFVLVSYSDSKCVNMIQNSISQFNTSSSCWTVGSQSFNPSTFNSTNNQLAVSFFNSSNSCGGSNINMLALDCSSSSCQTNPFNNNQSLKCLYSNVDLSAKFNVTSYTDNRCSSAYSGTTNYSPNNICWSVSSTSSIFPLNWNNQTNSLSLLMFGNSQCLGGSNSTTAGLMVCDGSCVSNGLSFGTYYTCKLQSSSSRFTMISVSALILTLFLSMLI